jgi:hypothetical protein
MTRSAAIFLAVLALGTSSMASAAPVWICAIVTATQVDEDGTIGEPLLDEVDWPTFFRVDVGRKELTVLAPASRADEVTPVDAVREGEDIWVLSGVQAGRGWSMVISEDGHVTIAVTGDGAVWNVFGHAMQEE